MGIPPIPLRKFKQLVESYGCLIQKTSQEWKVVNADGMLVSTFSVTHGKRTKGNEVKQIYKKKFLLGLELLNQNRETADE